MVILTFYFLFQKQALQTSSIIEEAAQAPWLLKEIRGDLEERQSLFALSAETWGILPCIGTNLYSDKNFTLLFQRAHMSSHIIHFPFLSHTQEKETALCNKRRNADHSPYDGNQSLLIQVAD